MKVETTETVVHEIRTMFSVEEVMNILYDHCKRKLPGSPALEIEVMKDPLVAHIKISHILLIQRHTERK